MNRSGTHLMIDVAQFETVIHIRYMRRSILTSLLFTFFIIVVDMANLMVAISMGVSAESTEDVLLLAPHPILFIALATSALVQFYFLRQLTSSMSGLSVHGTDARETDPNHIGKSITNVNYDIVGTMHRSLMIWPIIALLFVIYFIGSIFKIVELTLGLSSNETPNDATALNLITLFFAFIFFGMQTTKWLTRKRKLKELERMEMTVMEELHI